MNDLFGLFVLLEGILFCVMLGYIFIINTKRKKDWRIAFALAISWFVLLGVVIIWGMFRSI
jgi:hypothetical protein